MIPAVEPSAISLLIRLMVKMAWDRLLLLFMEVDSVERILEPLQRSSTASDTSVTATSVSCTTLNTGWTSFTCKGTYKKYFFLHYNKIVGLNHLATGGVNKVVHLLFVDLVE